SSVDTVVFDKTGTLTYGRPAVRQVLPAQGVTGAEVIEAAAIAERPSEHALATAIIAYADAAGVTPRRPDHFGYIPGQGVIAEVGDERIVVGNRSLLVDQGIDMPADQNEEVATIEVFVARDGRFLGRILIADTVREEARNAVAALAALGIRTILLTGDNHAVARAVATELGVTEVHADLLPEAKLDHIKALVAGG